MAQKKALTDEELLAQFEGIADNGSSTATKTPVKKGAAASKPLADDPLAELESLAKAKPTSRPSTPRLSSSALNRNRSPVRREAAATPSSSGSARNSEDKQRSNLPPRKSGESTRSFHQGLTPTSEETPDDAPLKKAAEPESQQQPSGGGWWGSVFATATAAVKQAEAAVKEIQKNEEAQRWATQVRGNVGALAGIGMFTFFKRNSDCGVKIVHTHSGDLQCLAGPGTLSPRLCRVL
jgi:hypothetical protein